MVYRDFQLDIPTWDYFDLVFLFVGGLLFGETVVVSRSADKCCLHLSTQFSADHFQIGYFCAFEISAKVSEPKFRKIIKKKLWNKIILGRLQSLSGCNAKTNRS